MASKIMDLGDGCSVELLYGAVACTEEEFAVEMAAFPTERNPTVFNATTPRREVLYSTVPDTTYAFSQKVLRASVPSAVAARCLRFARGPYKEKPLLACGVNAVLGNLYENGKDYVGQHGDDEPEHEATQPIFGFSFGATRHFQIKRCDKGDVFDGKPILNIPLPHGSCVVMRGHRFQRLFTHGIPKTAKVVGPRISFTARVFA